MKFSIIIPLYNCETYIEELALRLRTVCGSMDDEYELIFVDDFSPRADWLKVVEQCRMDLHVKGIRLSRNFGQHYAITAGLKAASGEWVVVMDGDLQDIPEEIPNLYAHACNGYDIVCAMRVKRKDVLWKRLTSRVFYKVFSYLTDTTQDPSIGNFGIYHRKVIDSILEMGDSLRYFPTMVQWVGFRSSKLAVEHGERQGSKSSYTVRKLLRLALNNILAFSEKPLRLAITIGFVFSSISGLISIVYLILYFLSVISVSGFASIFLSIWFLSGIVILILGVVGLYVGKVFLSVQDRPLYIVEKQINF